MVTTTDNPFIKKAKQKENPFLRKAVKSRAREIAETNYRELSKILASFKDGESPEARERVRLRVIEAKEALDSTA